MKLIPDPPADADPRISGPGCGLAAYAFLLLAICIVGLLGIGGATGFLLFQDGPTTSELAPGNQVLVHRLAPMRQSGVLGPTDVPMAYHDESLLRDGSRACALLTDQVVRVDESGGFTIRYADVTDVTHTGSENEGMSVRTTGARNETNVEAAFNCHFRPREGGIRFLRQLQTEVARAHR